MLIPVVDDYYDSGYLPDSGPLAVRGFFPNCNLALRRTAWAAVEGYDEELVAAEDMDLCRRVSVAGWRLFFEPEAACRHQARSDLRALARQWWGYGVASAEVQRKNRERAVELFVSAERAPRIHGFRRVVSIRRFPLKALVFVTPFRLAGLLMLVAAFAAILGETAIAAVVVAFGLATGAWTVARHPATARLRVRHLPGFLVVLVVLDLSSLLGGLWGGLRRGALYVLSVV